MLTLVNNMLSLLKPLGETTMTNILKTVKLFEAATKRVDRIVFASSSSVYGGAYFLPTPETTNKNPKSPYAWQKSAIEDYSKLCWELYNLDIVCLRYFNVFGKNQDPNGAYAAVIPLWVKQLINHESSGLVRLLHLLARYHRRVPHSVPRTTCRGRRVPSFAGSHRSGTSPAFRRHFRIRGAISAQKRGM